MASRDAETTALLSTESADPPGHKKTHARRRWLLSGLAAAAAALLLLGLGSASTRAGGPNARSVAGDVSVPDNGPATGASALSGQAGASTRRPPSATSTAPAAASTVLECFQVAQPVLMPQGPVDSDGSTASPGTGPLASGGEPCTVVLMDHVFAWSYGTPFVGDYTPPSCAFNRVVMNFTVVSEGRQYDRLALMYMNDTEVWRTSTAEPTQHPGIRWVYLKDMTQYLYFWRSPQRIIFDLGNLVDGKYTASFNTTLTATFFTADVDAGGAPPSDLIIPISARRGAEGAASQFTLPRDNATSTVGFPRNAHRAVFSVSANGQADEEFWWSNVLESDTGAFAATAGALPGLSPFREVQVYVDGRLAGVQWPFPVVFTGGVVPSLHRPIVGLGAFDLREHEIDITPWLPLLSDGAAHTFAIRVAGLDDDGAGAARLTEAVGSSWCVAGKIFVWLDPDPDAVTTGDAAPGGAAPPPAVAVSQRLTRSANGTNETLAYTTSVRRALTVSARVASRGGARTATWTQSLAYSNRGRAWDFGYSQLNDLSVEGSDEARLGGGGGGPLYRADYAYPLWCNSSYGQSAQGNLTIFGHLAQGLDLRVRGAAVFPTGLEPFALAGAAGAGGRAAGPRFPGGSRLATSRDGTAWFFQTGDGRSSSGYGSTAQRFTFGGVAAGGGAAELYRREVAAANGSVTADRERTAGVPTAGGPGGYGGGGGGNLLLFAPVPENGGKGGPRAFGGRQAAGGAA